MALAGRLLQQAKNTEILPVYVFDPRHFKESPWGSPKTGNHRSKFLMESVVDLKRNLRGLGSDLLVLHGHPEDVLPRLLPSAQPCILSYQSEVTYEETQVEKAVTAAAARVSAQVEIRPHWGATLYHKDDIPFREDLSDLPDGFTP